MWSIYNYEGVKMTCLYSCYFELCQSNGSLDDFGFMSEQFLPTVHLCDIDNERPFMQRSLHTLAGMN